MCYKGVCIEDLPVTNVGYVNNPVLLQAIEKFNIQPTQNVALKMKGPTRMNYTENTSIAEVCHMCKTGVNVLMLFV